MVSGALRGKMYTLGSQKYVTGGKVSFLIKQEHEERMNMALLLDSSEIGIGLDDMAHDPGH